MAFHLVIDFSTVDFNHQPFSYICFENCPQCILEVMTKLGDFALMLKFYLFKDINTFIFVSIY